MCGQAWRGEAPARQRECSRVQEKRVGEPAREPGCLVCEASEGHVWPYGRVTQAATWAA